jgi:hypothetical protein
MEVDRGTEPITSKSARESLTRKIAAYSEIVERDSHRFHYGLKSPMALLFTFQSTVRAQNFLSLLAGHPQLAATTLVQVLPADDPLLLRAEDYIFRPWMRASGGLMEIFQPSKL